LELPAAEYQVAVTPANDNSTIVAEYKKDFSFWNGKTAVIFASGFLSGDDPSFEPWVALSNGGTFPLDFVQTLVDPNGGNTNSMRVSNLGIYPNPASDFVQVKMNLENETDVEMSIFNNLGQAILTKDFGEIGKGQNSFELNVNNLETGIYFLQIRTDENIETKQIQVVK